MPTLHWGPWLAKIRRGGPRAGCLLTDSELFILFAEIRQILLKISVIPILLTLMYMVALNLLVNNQLNSLSNSTHHCCT